MKTTIGVYDSHEKAIKAIEKIKEGGFPVKQISLITKAEDTSEHIHVKSIKKAEESGEKAEEIEACIGVIAGPILGVLTGLGLFAIPGFGFVFGAGAVVGAMAGFDFGLVGGGVVSILTMIGVNIAHSTKYQNHLTQGRFLVIVQGTDQEINMAKEILENLGEHIELNVH